MNKVNLIVAAMDVEVQALLDNLEKYDEITLDGNTAYSFEIKDEKYSSNISRGKGKWSEAFNAYCLRLLYSKAYR